MGRGLRDSGWAAVAIAMIAPLGVAIGACGGRQTATGIQGDAASGFSSGNSSSGGSGFNAMGGSAGGTGSGSDGIGTTSSGAADGGSSGAASGSTGSGSTPAASGSVNLWPSGSLDAASPSRCGFSPDPGGASVAPTASAMLILSRIYQFLDDSPVAPPGAVLSQPTAAWASAQAMSILDGHLANGTEAPGLVRFLTAWLKVSPSDGGPSAARTWSLKLLDPSATLTTLLAGPTGDPHRIGVLTDPQVLMARPRISGRGTWMLDNLLCIAVPPQPPSTVRPFPPPMPGQTRREELASELAAPSCAACHRLVDPPGFSLEHFDELGNYRDLDNGKPVDSSGILYASMPMLAFTSIDDLAPRLAVACPVAQCFAKLVMSDAFGVPPMATNVPFTVEEANHVANAFANSNFSIRELVNAIVATPSFLR